jgi:3-oxoacyl-[acyl-carrier protein] reductase
MSEVILVTGASSDVGRALLTRLAAKDAVVYAHHASTGEKLKAHLATLTGPARFVPVQADFQKAEDVEALIETVRAAHGAPSRIVHLCARPLLLERFSKQKWDDVQADLEISVRSITRILQSFLPTLASAQTPARVVILLSSVTVGEPPKGMYGYSVVKFALLGVVRALAAEYADKRIGINGLSPYTMETPFLARVPSKYAEIAAAANPAKRNATPADVVPAIEFLLSDESGFITGANIPVTAGAAF